MNARRYHTYLGDGVYVYLDSYGAFVLYTSDGLSETNTIVIEPETLESLQEWMRGVMNEEGGNGADQGS